MWVAGTIGGEKIKRSLDITSWEAATDKIREWSSAGKITSVNAGSGITVEHAVAAFLAELKTRNVGESTIRKHELLLNERLKAFCARTGYTLLSNLTVERVREFRQTWSLLLTAPQVLKAGSNADRPLGPLTAAKYLERLRQFFRFGVENQWIVTNPASALKPPKIIQKPTLPFTPAEMDKIIRACPSERYKALVLLLRYSGLRISDAVTLPRDRVEDGKILLYKQKTGVPVYCPLPPEVVDLLDRCPNKSSAYYFWTGEGKGRVAVTNWRDDLSKVCRKAGVVGGHPHRFRDTFAVELLTAGVQIETVSILLGHSNVRVTQKHYSPWVQTRQQMLEKAVKKTWDSPKRATRLVRVK